MNGWLYTLPVSKIKNSNNFKKEWKTNQSHMEIILKYHKKGDKNSKYQPYMFIDTGYPVRI